MATFVLVHGGGQGGWVWRWTARLLQAEGHEVFTPTLTGFGARHHLNGPDVGFQTFLDDVGNLILFEDLKDVVLVGHSMGGAIIPRVAEALPDRIRRVVWLTAVVTSDGETLISSIPQSPWIARAVELAGDRIARTDPEKLLDANIADGTEEHRAIMRARERSGYPAHALREPGRLTAFLRLGLPTGYVLTTEDRVVEPHVQEGFARKLPDCRRAEIAAGHQCMLTQPRATADILRDMAA